MGAAPESSLSVAHGPPLAEEPGLGALTMPGFLREVCERYAEREALVFREGGETVRWSYAELMSRAEEVARSLLALGCGKDTRVGVLMTNRPEWLAAVFGVSIAGGVAVPLSTFSTESELDYLLRSSAVSVLIAERLVAGKDFAAMLHELEPAFHQAAATRSLCFPHLRHLVLLGELPARSAFESWDDFRARAAEVPAELAQQTAAGVLPADVGAIMFSSGSTAHPKGIVNSQRGIAIQLWRWRNMFDLYGEVRAWTPNGFFWSGNFCMVLGGTLAAGGSLVLQSLFDPEAALELMEAERVTFPCAWPHQWKRLLEASNWDAVDLGAVRFLDPCQPLADHPTISDSGWREPTFNYGSTETFTVTSGFYSNSPVEVIEGRSSILAGTTVRIVDPDTGEIQPRGEQGEIAVKGPTLMLGYLGLPPEESFDADGFYRTGDAGWLDDIDRLHFVGRLSTVIKTGGANVSPLEIDVVLESMPEVKVARCVGVPDEDLGEKVVACVVVFEGASLTADAVRAFAKSQLASFKVPREVLFFDEDEVQLTGSAKVKPAQLREIAGRKLKRGGGHE